MRAFFRAQGLTKPDGKAWNEVAPSVMTAPPPLGEERAKGGSDVAATGGQRTHHSTSRKEYEYEHGHQTRQTRQQASGAADGPVRKRGPTCTRRT